MDETGGGVEAHCNGAASKDGFYYFYDVVKPGDPAPPLKATMIPEGPRSRSACPTTRP